MKKLLISLILFITIVSIGTISLIPMVAAQTCRASNLVATFSPREQNGTRGETLNYLVTIQNNNDATCGTGTFYLTANLQRYGTGWTITGLPSSVTLSPGQSTSFTLSVRSSTTAEYLSYSYIIDLAAALLAPGYEIGTGPSTYYVIGQGFYKVIPTCHAANLYAVFSPKSQEGRRGEALTYTISITNNNEEACGEGTFYLDVSLQRYQKGWIITDFPSQITLWPGESKSFTLKVKSPTDAELREYIIDLSAASVPPGTFPTDIVVIGQGFYTVIEMTTTIPAEESFEIKLYKGWNMISSSIQRTMLITDIENAGCDLISYKGFKTWHYDPLNGWTHPNYIPNDGVYVYSNNECRASFYETKYTFTSKQLYRGWNMISGDGYLADILGTCKNHVIKYQGYELWRYNPLKRGWDNPTLLEPTKGYFIKVDQDCRLEYEVGGPPVPG